MSEENNDIENSEYSFKTDMKVHVNNFGEEILVAQKTETHNFPGNQNHGTMGYHQAPWPNTIRKWNALSEYCPELGEVINQELERVRNHAEEELFRALPVEVEKTENAVFETKTIELSIKQEVDLNSKYVGLEIIYTSAEFKELADFYENHPYKLNLAIPAAKVIGNMFNYEDHEDISWIRGSLFEELKSYCREKPELLGVVFEVAKVWLKPLLSSNK